MNCGNCNKTDGLCYTSNPPQVKCTVTGKFHFYGDECDACATKEINIQLAKACIVCGESVPLEPEDVLRLEHGLSVESKICENCRRAIKYVREQLDTIKPSGLDKTR